MIISRFGESDWLVGIEEISLHDKVKRMRPKMVVSVKGIGYVEGRKPV